MGKSFGIQLGAKYLKLFFNENHYEISILFSMINLTVRLNSILATDHNNQLVHVSMQTVLPPRNLSEMECLGEQ